MIRLSRRPLRVARRQRQLGDVGVGGRDHIGVVGFDDLGAGHRVDETTGEGGDDDLVARLEVVDVLERPVVRHAVAGDRGVAVLAGQWRVRVVAGPAPEVVDRDPGDDDDVEPDVGDLEAGDRITLGDRRDGRRHGVGTVSGTVSGDGAGVVPAPSPGWYRSELSSRSARRRRRRGASSASNSSSSAFWARRASIPVPHSW